MKKECYFSSSKVEKTLIFYTHTHTHTHLIIAEKKKSPLAILTETAERLFRMVKFILSQCHFPLDGKSKNKEITCLLDFRLRGHDKLEFTCFTGSSGRADACPRMIGVF